MSGPTVAVTGASGYIGAAFIRALGETGAHVIAIGRRERPLIGMDEMRLVRDLGAEDTPADIFAGVDTLVHLAAHVQPDAKAGPTAIEDSPTVRIARTVGERATAAGIPRILSLSSIAAQIAQDTPTHARAYGIEKLKADEVLAASIDPARSLVTLRPPAVYGPDAKNSLATLVTLVRKGLPLPFANARAPRDYIARENLVSLLVAMTMAPSSAWQVATGGIFAPSDGQAVDTATLARHMATAMGRKVTLFPAPATLMRPLAGLAGKGELMRSIFDPLDANDNAVLKEVFGWTPPRQMPETFDYLKV